MRLNPSGRPGYAFVALWPRLRSQAPTRGQRQLASRAMAHEASHWHVELDGDTGSDGAFRIGAAEKVTVGYLIRAYDRRWIVDFVDRERKRAHAVEVHVRPLRPIVSRST